MFSSRSLLFSSTAWKFANNTSPKNVAIIVSKISRQLERFWFYKQSHSPLLAEATRQNKSHNTWSFSAWITCWFNLAPSSQNRWCNILLMRAMKGSNIILSSSISNPDCINLINVKWYWMHWWVFKKGTVQLKEVSKLMWTSWVSSPGWVLHWNISSFIQRTSSVSGVESKQPDRQHLHIVDQPVCWWHLSHGVNTQNKRPST